MELSRLSLFTLFLSLEDQCPFQYELFGIRGFLLRRVFFAWEAPWGKVLTLNQLQRRGWVQQIDVLSIFLNKSRLITFFYIVRMRAFVVPFWCFLGGVVFCKSNFARVSSLLCWKEMEKKCGKQPHCAFFGHCGKREIEKLLIMRNFRTKD